MHVLLVGWHPQPTNVPAVQFAEFESRMYRPVQPSTSQLISGWHVGALEALERVVLGGLTVMLGRLTVVVGRLALGRLVGSLMELSVGEDVLRDEVRGHNVWTHC